MFFSFMLIMVPIVTLAMPRLVLRHIDVIVPSFFYEIDGTAAGIVFRTVLAPLLFMPGWDVNVYRLINDTGRSVMNHDRPCIDDLRPRIGTDVDAAVKTGLAHADRHADIGSLRRRGGD